MGALILGGNQVATDARINGHLRSFHYWDEVLPDLDLKALT
jgi:hypothetical protein